MRSNSGFKVLHNGTSLLGRIVGGLKALGSVTLARKAGLTALAGAGLLAATAAAQAESRSLTFFNIHTKERATITYKVNGVYVPAGLSQINQYLRDWRKNQSVKMDPKLLDMVWTVYRQTGARQGITVICGYRSSGTNEMLRGRSRGVAKESQHTRGKALDFYLPGVALADLRAAALRLGGGGVGYYPTSGSPFVHMDTGRVRHWPRMSEQELAKVMRGKTLPSGKGGKPEAPTLFASASATPDSGAAKGPGLFEQMIARMKKQGQESDGEAGGDSVAASPAARPVAKPAAPKMPEPAAPVPAEPVIAAAPAPKPAKAPRSQEPAQETVIAGASSDLPGVEAEASLVAESQRQVEEAPEPVRVANVPVPVRRPDYVVPDVMVAEAKPAGALSAEEIDGLRRDAVPIPAERSTALAFAADDASTATAAIDALIAGTPAPRQVNPGTAQMAAAYRAFADRPAPPTDLPGGLAEGTTRITTDTVGRWALTNDRSVGRIAEMSAPRYAMNARRGSPDMVADAGFVPSRELYPTGRFALADGEPVTFRRLQ